jgi:hypothetical protein
MKRNNPNQLQIRITGMYRMNGGFAVSTGTGTIQQRRIGSIST